MYITRISQSIVWSPLIWFCPLKRWLPCQNRILIFVLHKVMKILKKIIPGMSEVLRRSDWPMLQPITRQWPVNTVKTISCDLTTIPTRRFEKCWPKNPLSWNTDFRNMIHDLDSNHIFQVYIGGVRGVLRSNFHNYTALCFSSFSLQLVKLQISMEMNLHDVVSLRVQYAKKIQSK